MDKTADIQSILFSLSWAICCFCHLSVVRYSPQCQSHSLSLFMSVVYATSAEWAAQVPTLLLGKTNNAPIETITSAANALHTTPLKRRSSSGGGGSGNSKRHQRYTATENGSTDTSISLITAPMLGGSLNGSQSRLYAPSFASIPNAIIPPHPSKHTVVAPSTIPHPSVASSTMISSTPLPLRLTKKQNKMLTQDFAAYKSSLSHQASLVVETMLPKRVLSIARLEQQFERERANAEKEQTERENTLGVTAADPVAAHASQLTQSELQVQIDASIAANSIITSLPVPTPDGSRSFIVPITNLLTHKPLIRATLPALGSQCVQHGWSFKQPLRPHPLNSFASRWCTTLQSELGDLVSVCALLRCSVTLTLPEADDANNTRLEVTEELLAELKGKEDWATAQKGRFVSYSLQRAKLCSKTIKYPGIPDYVRAVAELDAYTAMLMQISLSSLRNSYLLLYQLYQKNAALLIDDPTGDQAFQSMLA
jgi:hypothetical protein